MAFCFKPISYSISGYLGTGHFGDTSGLHLVDRLKCLQIMNIVNLIKVRSDYEH